MRKGQNNQSCRWTIHDEKMYLLHLGTGTWSRETRMSRIQLLESYIDTVGYRSERWTREAAAYAIQLLAQEYEEEGYGEE